MDAVNAFSCVATWCQWCGGLRFKLTQHRFSNPPLGSDQLVYTLTLVSRHGFLQFSAFYVSFLKETKTPSCAPLKLQVQASSEEKVVGNKHGACMEGFYVVFSCKKRATFNSLNAALFWTIWKFAQCCSVCWITVFLHTECFCSVCAAELFFFWKWLTLLHLK